MHTNPKKPTEILTLLKYGDQTGGVKHEDLHAECWPDSAKQFM